MADPKMQVIIDLKDKANAKLKASSSNLSKSFGTIAKVGVAAFAAISVAIGKTVMDIDKANSTLVKMTGASGDALKQMIDTARLVNRHVPQNLGEVSEIVGELNTRLGVEGDQLAFLSDQFANFARVTGSDGKDAVRSVTRLMGDWGVEIKDADVLLDKLTKAGQKTGISIDQLAGVGTTYGVQLRTMGFSLDETIALLSKFEVEGVSTEKMVAGLSMALGRMAQEGINDPAEGFKELTSRIAEAGSVGEATSIAIEMLGTRAGPDFALAVLEGRFAIDDYVKALEDSAGVLDETAINSLTLGEKIKMLTQNFFDILTPGGSMNDVFNNLINTTLKWTQNTADAIHENGGLYSMLGEKIGELGAWIEKKTGLITVLKEVWDNLVLMFKARLFPAIKDLWVALQPLMPFIETFVKLVGVLLLGAFIALIKFIEISVIVTIEILTTIVEKVTEKVQWFTDGWDKLTESLIPVVNWLDKVIEKIEKINILQGAKKFVGGILGFGGERADGGQVSSQKSYLVGERGPELFNPSSNGNIIPNHKLGGGGVTVNVIVQGSVMAEQDLASSIGDILTKQLQLSSAIV